jgi:RNase H-fold protein (predicted Holliday junction resolvase)
VRVLSIDPGRDKCGVAVVDDRDGVLARGIVPTGVIEPIVRDWARAHRPKRVVMGDGTGSAEVRRVLAEAGAPITVVDERHTTERARRRYFEENPPRGWRRLIPRGLLSPPVPVDDYAAILIGEDYLAAQAAESP